MGMTASLFDLAGRTALVTGSSTGLGLAIARGLAGAGAAIVLNGRNETKLAAAAKTFKATGHKVRALAFDVADEAAVLRGFEALDRDRVEIDILVNNAGIQLRKPMIDITGDEWRRVIDADLNAAFIVGREAAKRMIARGKGGKIINIASLASEVARATIAPYTAAKGALRMLTRSMTAEWAVHGVQANAIGPGYFATEMTQPLVDNEKFDTWVKNRTPARRWGQPDELIGVAVFLAARASDFVNGQIIYVDGGLLAVM
jgi:gluconate 5-dehydrogenase